MQNVGASSCLPLWRDGCFTLPVQLQTLLHLNLYFLAITENRERQWMVLWKLCKCRAQIVDARHRLTIDCYDDVATDRHVLTVDCDGFCSSLQACFFSQTAGL